MYPRSRCLELSFWHVRKRLVVTVDVERERLFKPYRNLCTSAP